MQNIFLNLKMISFIGLIYSSLSFISHAGTVSKDSTVTSVCLSQKPSANVYDLAQTHYQSSSGKGSYESESDHNQLFNGKLGNHDDTPNDDGEVRMGNRSSITIDFDVSEHTNGYDIRKIDLFFGEKAPARFRANQNYSIQVTFMDNTSAKIRPQKVTLDSSTSYWNIVTFNAGKSGVIASGVKSMTFTLSEKVNANGLAIGREIDILGSPTGLEYSMVIERPNGDRIPKILGASGDLALKTGFDYFKWYGVTEHRTWFKPSFSSLADDSSITSAKAFAEATQAIRKQPTKQAKSSDYFIDWNHFHNQLKRHKMPEIVSHLADRGITPLINNTKFVIDSPITDDWVNRFKYWKYWYTMVYHFSSKYDITMYAFRNEPHAGIDYDTWESHWLVCADAMRKAMDDVNANFGKTLKLNICGPNCPGVYWDYRYAHPDEDIHCWGSASWEKVKYDVYGKYNINNPWNYGMYHFHRYSQDGESTQNIILNAREDISNARNDRREDIPLVITELNTSTTGNFNKREIDPEDLYFGVAMAQILESTAVHGEKGLGDDGGFFIFKLGEHQSGSPLVGLGNKLNYSSQNKPYNYGGVTRGGACFQMYARHFRGGKPLLPVSVRSGESDKRRTVAVVDEAEQAYYIYGSNVAGTDVPISIDLKALKVQPGAVVSLQRVDQKNTGQITDILKLDDTKSLSFYAPNYTAFLVKVPMASSLSSYKMISPEADAMVNVLDPETNGSSPTIKVSMHHSDAKQRNAGLLRFRINKTKDMGEVLLNLSGRNTGKDPLKREILHIYAVKDADWNEHKKIKWQDTPGLGKYYINDKKTGSADGTGEMIDIEDNYAGFTDSPGKGLGIHGEFIGALSFHSAEYKSNYLDVSDYLKSVATQGKSVDVTFVVVRIVRYNVNEYENTYYTLGDYHYDGRTVEIATKEHTDKSLHPRLIYSTKQQR